MYTYSFNVYHKDSPYVYLSMFLEAKDRFTPYDSILIKVFNEKREDWSTSVQDSYQKKGIYSGRYFFDWLCGQCLYGYGVCSLGAFFSPFDLYSILSRSDSRYDVLVDTDDPEKIDDPGTYFEDMYKDLPPDVDF